jgi:hypothetical protein
MEAASWVFVDGFVIRPFLKQHDGFQNVGQIKKGCDHIGPFLLGLDQLGVSSSIYTFPLVTIHYIMSPEEYESKKDYRRRKNAPEDD